MGWYQVVKTVKGHRYLYWQTSWREGGKVKTKSRYIGTANGWVPIPKISPDAITLTLPFPTPRPEPLAIVDVLCRPVTGIASWRPAWSKRLRTNRVVINEKVERLLSDLKVHRTDHESGCYYTPDTDCLNMPPMRMFKSTEYGTATEEYYVTLLHEMVHWSGHRGRLDRLDGVYGQTGYAREELVAELGAIMLMKHMCIEKDLRMSGKYFQTWLKRAGNKDEALNYAKREAERAVQFILKGGMLPG